jgi:hypothetical protein
MLIRREKSAWVAASMSLVLPLLFLGKSALAVALMALPAYYVVAWACGMDFKYRADRFICSLPKSRAGIVAHRFAGGLVAWTVSFALTSLCWTLVWALGSGLSMAALPPTALLSLAATMIVVGTYLAAYYVFGYQNARWAIILVIGLGAAAAGALGSAGPASAGSGSPAEAMASLISGSAGAGVYLAAALVALGAYAAAYLVSVAAYRRKQF